MEREKAVEIMLKDFDEISDRMRNISMRGSAKAPQIFLANSLVDIGYRKLDNPDNAIILSRKEFEMYKYFANVGDKEIEKAKQQVRKETARKALREVKEVLDGQTDLTIRFTLAAVIVRLKNLFGVEVDE